MSWSVAAASTIGTSHIRTSLPCQDSAGVELVDTANGAVLVCVVSDGAGSAAYAELGSKAAVETSIRVVRGFLESGGTVCSIERELAASWLSEVQRAITKLAEAAGSTAREFACTLLVAIIASDYAAFLQVGDGAMVIGNEADDDWSYIFWPQHGEFANSTNFVTASNSIEIMDFKTLDQKIDSFASFSDGIESLVLHYATKSVHAPFFKAMLALVRQSQRSGLDGALSESLARYLGSERVCERTDDDKTLVLASRNMPMNHSASDASS
jgi:hypothetical protein